MIQKDSAEIIKFLLDKIPISRIAVEDLIAIRDHLDNLQSKKVKPNTEEGKSCRFSFYIVGKCPEADYPVVYLADNIYGKTFEKAIINFVESLLRGTIQDTKEVQKVVKFEQDGQIIYEYKGFKVIPGNNYELAKQYAREI